MAPFDLNNLTVLHDEVNRRFVIPLGEDEALINYSLAGDKIIFLHTEVPPAFEGKGIAAKITKEALEFARTQKLKVISLCSYISRYISRHPEYQSLQEVMD
jgi:predicted GNAT family acetyltransferase